MKKTISKKASKKSHRVSNPMGRPKFAVTKKMRDRVQRLISCGMSQKQIANAIGCTPPTLVLHFKEELETGSDVKRARVLELLWDKAEEGNVSAQRKLVSMTHGGDLNDENMKFSSTKYDEDFDIKDRPKHNKKYAKTKQGKKEQQQEEADAISGKFAPQSPPKLVVDNSNK